MPTRSSADLHPQIQKTRAESPTVFGSAAVKRMEVGDAQIEERLQAARRGMFLDFCALLETSDIPYVILSGHASYPDRINSDVDFLISEQDFNRVTSLLCRTDSIAGARLLQILEHETSARYFVFVMQFGGRLAFLHPDAAASVRKDARLRLTSAQALSSRRLKAAGFWIPSPAVELEYYFVKRIEKKSLQACHLANLQALFREDPAGCKSALVSLLGKDHGALVADRIGEGNIDWLTAHGPSLHEWVMSAPQLESPPARLRNRFSEWLRVVRRVARPTGLVIAVLGPDGSGKTTVLDHLGRELAPAFRRVRRYHLRPHFGSTRPGTVVTDPHGKTPRGWGLSTAKMALFLCDYLWGWARTIWPDTVRSTLVLFDRYFHDMLVDPTRYRLPRVFPAARWLAPLIPAPHMWLVLTAPAPVLLARKNELTEEAAQSLDSAYRSLAATLPNAVLIDTGQPIADVLEQAVAAVCDHLATRMRTRSPCN